MGRRTNRPAWTRVVKERHEDRLYSSGGVCPFGGLGVACAGLTTVLGVPGPSSGTRWARKVLHENWITIEEATG